MTLQEALKGVGLVKEEPKVEEGSMRSSVPPEVEDHFLAVARGDTNALEKAHDFHAADAAKYEKTDPATAFTHCREAKHLSGRIGLPTDKHTEGMTRTVHHFSTRMTELRKQYGKEDAATTPPPVLADIEPVAGSLEETETMERP